MAECLFEVVPNAVVRNGSTPERWNVSSKRPDREREPLQKAQWSMSWATSESTKLEMGFSKLRSWSPANLSALPYQIYDHGIKNGYDQEGHYAVFTIFQK